MSILPQIFLFGLILIVLFLEISVSSALRRAIPGACVGGIAIALLSAFVQIGPKGLALTQAYVLDPIAAFFQVFFLITALIIAILSREYVQRFDRGVGEFYVLLLLATEGMLFLNGATNLLILFVALEVITLSFYAMTAYHRTQERSLEAGTKYLVLGALSSAILLYGMAFVYGATGSVNFSDVARGLQECGFKEMAMLGLVLILAGVGFKIACVPFQLWVADVYQGAPTPVTAFLSVGSKAAGFVILLRVLYGIFGSLQNQWLGLVSALAAMTILYGNLGALLQHNMKRLLGYSSIGHAGYLLIGIAAGSALGIGAVLFYLAAYLFTNLAAFLVLTVVAQSVEGEEISYFNGLSKRSPFLAGAMFLALLSLAGVPPLAGFAGKFFLLLSAVNSGLVWLAIIGAVNVVISLYYYLMIINAMYFKAPETPEPIPMGKLTRAALIACLAGILGLGLAPAPCLDVALAAVQTFF